jgi:predicted nucleic acid-binding Zn ribbon protein
MPELKQGGTMPKLKKCPFCARDVEIIKFNERCYTICCSCGAESPKDSVSEVGVARIWNRRRLETLEEQCQKN